MQFMYTKTETSLRAFEFGRACALSFFWRENLNFFVHPRSIQHQQHHDDGLYYCYYAFGRLFGDLPFLNIDIGHLQASEGFP